MTNFSENGIIIALVLPLIAAIIAPIIMRLTRPNMAAVILALLPLTAFIIFTGYINDIYQGITYDYSLSWVPSYNIELSFYLDGFSLLFALLITGIGTLIIIYAGDYLKENRHISRFMVFILLFMFSMLGVVIADHILSFFIFWEMTSITSFLLIGFEYNRSSARRAALQALIVTGGGGLALLAGLLLIAMISGSYNLSDITASGDIIRSSTLYGTIFWLIIIGAFTKSAQFPFHFWLPNAMEAPTPVSAYLHSATMVKAGVYLLYRLNPVLSQTDLWHTVLPVIGAITLILGMILAVSSTKLKSILAYTTVASLGMMVMVLGMNELAEGKEFFNFRLNHSHNHNLIAVSVDDKGSEYFDIKVYDIAAKKFTSDLISKTNGYIAWSGDSQYIFYVELDDNHRSVAVHRHAVGTKMSEDVEVYRENDKSFFVNVDNTLSKRFIVINTGEHHTSEVHLIPAAKPENKPKVVEPRQKGVKYTVLDGGDKFFIRTNADGADDYKIVTAPIDEPGAGNWREFVAHTPGRLILHATVFKNHLVRLEQENAVRRIIIHDRATTKEHAVTFADETYALNTQEGYEYDTSNLRFEYSSMRQPNQVFDYNMRTKSRELRKQQEIPAGHDPDQYEIKLLMAPAHDGETIPVSVLYKKGTKLDGSAPCLLYGYGSYGITITPGFRITPLSLVNRGFVYAIAHIRGGRARGENWYQQTRKFGKTKTFYDFISAAHYLVDNDYTSEGAIVAQGGSAGGMLMGAIANINPRLFGGIIANVPFVDVLNTMLDDSLPLTPPEWPEWGNPIARVEEFAMIRSYSPYDNISEQTYPPILATGGLTDPRVTYWEPSKWVAKLREFNRSKSPILLHMNMGAGHSGVSGRFASLKETALEHAFAIFAVGKPLT